MCRRLRRPSRRCGRCCPREGPARDPYGQKPRFRHRLARAVTPRAFGGDTDSFTTQNPGWNAMRIVAIEPMIVEVPMRTPVKGVHGVTRAQRSVLVRIATDADVEGWGNV